MAKKRRIKKKHSGIKMFAGIFSIFMMVLGLLFFTTAGNGVLINIAGNYIYDKLDYIETNKSIETMETVGSEEIDTEVLTGKLGKDVINILLLGIEEIEGAKNTDAIIIATLNKKNNTIKLTSLMRDLYVDIPGHNKNRINSVYAKGGIELLYQTIFTNFGIPIDGYAKVGFDAFENIVDMIGGVDVKLTQKEASYLNSTNYISKKEHRVVQAGTQTLNGNQTMGYVRIRKVATETEASDFGRTQRQRVVLNGIFDKVRSKNIVQLTLLMNSILNGVDIETDITKKQFTDVIATGIRLDIKNMENKRIPSDGNYKNIKVKLGKYNQDMLEPSNWKDTRIEIRDFIYGDLDK